MRADNLERLASHPLSVLVESLCRCIVVSLIVETQAQHYYKTLSLTPLLADHLWNARREARHRSAV